MNHNGNQFGGRKLQGPSQQITVTPSDKGAEEYGVAEYTLEMPVGDSKKDAGKRIATAMKSGGGLPKPDKVEFNKDWKVK
jgi:hypothetical protein